jgi:hypothetical protein
MGNVLAANFLIPSKQSLNNSSFTCCTVNMTKCFIGFNLETKIFFRFRIRVNHNFFFNHVCRQRYQEKYVIYPSYR